MACMEPILGLYFIKGHKNSFADIFFNELKILPVVQGFFLYSSYAFFIHCFPNPLDGLDKGSFMSI